MLKTLKMLKLTKRMSILSSLKQISLLSTSREQMHYDVLAVGAGPAGLSAAIRLKQLALKHGKDISVCVIEKGSEVGAHILSGNVFEPKALDELLPDWRSIDPPFSTKATKDEFLILSENSSISVPHVFLPPQLNNEGNFIISLSQLTRWLAAKAEELGVEIYPGFAADEVLYDTNGNVIGVATKDAGIAKDGTKKDTYTRGIELIAKQTMFSEGCRGSCSEEVIKKFDLRKGKDIQTYGLGIKEVWEVPEGSINPGYIQHTLGWPLQNSLFSDIFGGTFLYHMEPNLILVGMVVGLDYSNPYLNPYKEFQRWKHHPSVSKHLKNGKCISYGARVLNEGGFHAIPKLTFPGGMLLGCSAGFLNSVKIKGTHTAMKSGMLAADATYSEIVNDENINKPLEIIKYEKLVMSSWIADELKQIRNTHASFHWGTLAGLIYTAFSCFISKGKEPWTLKNTVSDSDKTALASKCKSISYPSNDGILSFDLLTNLQRSGTSHDHDQPSHLKIKENLSTVPSTVSIVKYAGPEQRFCPAGVYEYTEKDKEGKQSLIINAQNCVHCKCCSIKMPKEYIKWGVPESGGGPSYTLM